MDKKIYITTPIYYVNDVPHVGHAYTTIAADVLARYYKSLNKEVFFLTGTDEHGAKIAEAAKKSGKEPKEFVDSLVPRFESAWKNLNIKYDGFIRTTDPKHEEVVKDLVSKLKEKGFIEKRSYEGLYCVGCERFLNDDELVDGKCPDHGKEPVKQSEENYFFLLSKFEDKLKKAIDAGDYEISPEARKNEVLGKIEQGLEDVSISRAAVEWGIPFPDDPEQTIYVWIDALINYLSATEIYANSKSQILKSKQIQNSNSEIQNSNETMKQFNNLLWPADIHLMAKDILWFHAVIWPALLMALELPLPKKIFAHGFFTIDDKKMSKTLGNVLDPNKLVEKFGSDAVRYALLREFPFGEDGDISEEKIALRYQKDLANGLGNLLNRTINMIQKYQIPNDKLQINSKSQSSNNDKIENLKFCEDLQEIWKQIGEKNAFIDENKPWELAKEAKTKELEVVLVNVFQFLNSLIPRLSPYIPEIAEKMKTQLETLKPAPLFPRLEN